MTTSYRQVPFEDFHGLTDAVKRGKFKICIQESTAFHNAILVRRNGVMHTVMLVDMFLYQIHLFAAKH